ncbi:hypothetical protein BOTBODRAFT_30954 [Botryobasidium botryosum FD-172 SS1]|uniref:PHD-type domain-containing protein n=1 Tax=Botryobasidium botryosum (strain FD-172 SS1) TaxID=930990 RepID=A0A067MND8_BOTB1|nr:hypothetical protein BOTBODRAFT_30954 [Botryobasidium botryosum FD-172 SS1]
MSGDDGDDVAMRDDHTPAHGAHVGLSHDVRMDDMDDGSRSGQATPAELHYLDILERTESPASSSFLAQDENEPTEPVAARPKPTKSAAKGSKKGRAKAQAKPKQVSKLKRAKADTPDSRSRSVSVMPSPAVKEEQQAKDAYEEIEGMVEEKKDDSLYCICRTHYDEDNVMIACDRCDEWYHTKCVSIRDTEVELIDQFICPKCVIIHPNLCTTYKTACANPGCLHPARTPFSKYCSDKCGIEAVMARVDAWSGNINKLAEVPAVKRAKRVEGVVNVSTLHSSMPLSNEDEVQLGRLKEALDKVTRERESRLALIRSLVGRIGLLKHAEKRADGKASDGLCGFDIRMCWDEQEWREWFDAKGRELIEEAEENKVDDERMEEDDSEWYCVGKRKCDRHVGWQKLKLTDFELEKSVNERSLELLTTRERDLRRRIEDLESEITFKRAQAELRNKRETIPLVVVNGTS